MDIDIISIFNPPKKDENEKNLGFERFPKTESNYEEDCC